MVLGSRPRSSARSLTDEAPSRARASMMLAVESSLSAAASSMPSA